jgi:tyrosyl-tRNA synthetase
VTGEARVAASVGEQLAVLMSGTEYGDEQTRRTMERELGALLEEGRPLSVYCGYDPTRPDLHLGHTVTMRKLQQFQKFGHEVTFLIGDFTGLVGDTSDKESARPMLTAEELEENARTYADQVFRILDRERTTVRHNAEWLGKLTFADVIRLCSNFTVAQFLERDNFHKRWDRQDPIGLHEFLYAIMQAYDAVTLETDVQVGGSEQLFNLLAGRTLQREFGQRPQVVITVPILVGLDGHERMSKSAGNYIAVDDPPNEMYGKVMSLPDTALANYFTLVTELHPDQVRDVLAAVEAGELRPMEAKKRLALEVTASMYSRPEAERAQAYFESTIQRRETPEEMTEYAPADEADGNRLDRVLVGAGLAASGGEVRRLVQQGAVQLNGERVQEFTTELHRGDVVKVGRHRFLRIVTEREARAGAQ